MNIYQVNVNLHNGESYNVMHYTSAKKAVNYAWKAYKRCDAELLGYQEKLNDIKSAKHGSIIITIINHERIKNYVITKRRVF